MPNFTPIRDFLTYRIMDTESGYTDPNFNVNIYLPDDSYYFKVYNISKEVNREALNGLFILMRKTNPGPYGDVDLSSNSTNLKEHTFTSSDINDDFKFPEMITFDPSQDNSLLVVFHDDGTDENDIKKYASAFYRYLHERYAEADTNGSFQEDHAYTFIPEKKNDPPFLPKKAGVSILRKY